MDSSSKTTHMVLFPGLNSPIQVKISGHVFVHVFLINLFMGLVYRLDDVHDSMLTCYPQTCSVSIGCPKCNRQNPTTHGHYICNRTCPGRQSLAVLGPCTRSRVDREAVLAALLEAAPRMHYVRALPSAAPAPTMFSVSFMGFGGSC